MVRHVPGAPHGVRSEAFRYIRYADGPEELYDMRSDPNEWHNLAGLPEIADVLEAHRRWLPASSAKPGAGQPTPHPDLRGWCRLGEGEEIAPDEPVPEI